MSLSFESQKKGIRYQVPERNSLKEMLKVNKTIILLLLLSWMAVPVIAQHSAEQTLKLSLEEALLRANQEGFEVQISKRETEVAKAEYLQSNAAFLPQLSVEETAVQTNDPIGVFGIKLRQGIITSADFNPALLNDPDKEHNFTTSFQLNQPVFNPDALLQRSAAKYMYRSAEQKQQAVEEYTYLKVKETYFRLAIIDQQLNVIKKHLDTVKEFEKQAKDYQEQGLITKADYLNARVQVLNAEKDLLATRNARNTLNDQFLIMLGIDSEQTVEISDPLEIGEVENYSSVSFEGENATLRAYSNQVKASEQMLKSSRFTFLPKLNVFGTYELHDTSVFGNQADNYTIGASLRWDLFKGLLNVGKVARNKAQYRKAELMYEQKQIQHRSDIKQAKRSIDEAIQTLALSEAALEQSKEDVRIRSDRFEQGLEKTSDVLQSEVKHLKTELERLQAMYQYYMSVAQLEFLLETDL